MCNIHPYEHVEMFLKYSETLNYHFDTIQNIGLQCNPSTKMTFWASDGYMETDFKTRFF